MPFDDVTLYNAPAPAPAASGGWLGGGGWLGTPSGGTPGPSGLGDPSRYSLFGGGPPPVAPSYQNAPPIGVAPPSTYQAPAQRTPEEWDRARREQAAADAAKRERFGQFGQMIVGLAQAGANAYAASRQQDLDKKLFQIVYGHQGGGGPINIDNPYVPGR
jgi:hypothetical protein